jgi:lipopolysaccharide/colanic/teichoic acid biosynthesis glycosyltransferase
MRAHRRFAYRSVDRAPVRYIAIGDQRLASAFAGLLAARYGSHTNPLAAVVPVADIDGLDVVIRREAPAALVLLDHSCSDSQLQRLFEIARRSRLRLQVRSDDLGDDPVCLLPGATSPVFAVAPSALHHHRYALKRVFDVGLAAVLLVLLAPFFALVAALTKLASPGPVFYVSRRMGVAERSFSCYKFRTMCVGADVQQEELESRNEADGCLFKIADDPRVTRVGRFLRRTSLDELPQLANVVLGQMSLVGPRPLPLRDVGRMETKYRRRHAVLPGMTGLWQVSGRSLLRASDMLDLDFEYIRTWSLRADLSILWRTVTVVLRGKGAY